MLATVIYPAAVNPAFVFNFNGSNINEIPLMFKSVKSSSFL
ncbi:hypothetical protein JCM19296_3387 [Nonlabens ulvanivorans]|uniref:Uncharacterized protein n=1 Tax=Nonlabens ulvanivorans TaxID=906888 RepID=A0A081DFT2_NONUL|nr:hypothetical protein JCM19296_3387 [Nonlabens ulvanivorans]